MSASFCPDRCISTVVVLGGLGAELTSSKVLEKGEQVVASVL